MNASTHPTPTFAHQRGDHGAHVIALETDAASSRFLESLLMGSRYRVTMVATAEAACSALARELPDLVLLDLPGLAVCQFLRSLPEGEDIPVLILTRDDHPERHAEAVRAGADDFLRKPLWTRELQSRTRSLIRLRQLRRELRRDRDAIMMLQAQKDELLQFVVHDLKNMLGTLLCGVDLMEGSSAKEWLRQRQRVRDTARTVQGMVESMLDLSVHEQAGLVTRPERIELAPWLKQIRLEFEALAMRRNQALQFTVEPGLALEADPQLLQRTLLNLLENASKFGPPGSEVHLAAYRDGTGIRIQITDQGQGIPAAMKVRIFDRFVRLDQQAGANAGRGLGLAFCRLVTELHGGRIWVEDNHPGGSRFVLALPA